MLRQVKPRNARSKRALEHREPKAVENPKTALFLRGTTCSQVAQDALADLYALRQPLAKKFSKKNPVHPFDDASSLEFFSEKNDASLVVFASSSKKRPHTLTVARTFAHKLYDMVELSLDAESYRRIAQFGGDKVTVGLRPMVVFAGAQFESPVANEYTLAKSMLLDLFRGDSSADKIDVEGLRYVVSVSAEDSQPSSGTTTSPLLRLRVYLIRTKRSGQRLPRVEVEEMGPRMDLRVGRVRQPDEAMAKEAMKRAKLPTEERTKKNISMDAMGDKLGNIHMGKLDLSQLQTRKMKGLKRGRDQEAQAGGAEAEEDEANADADADAAIVHLDDEPKKKKRSKA